MTNIDIRYQNNYYFPGQLFTLYIFPDSKIEKHFQFLFGIAGLSNSTQYCEAYVDISWAIPCIK